MLNFPGLADKALRFADVIARLSRPDNVIPNEYAKPPVGRMCYSWGAEEDYSISFVDRKTIKALRRAGLREGVDFRRWYDAIGNLYIMILGTDPLASAVLVLSHVDSVPLGGRFDGVIGAAFGNVVAELIANGDRPKRPYVFMVPRGEESSPHNGTACVGSGYATRTLAWRALEEMVYKTVEEDGVKRAILFRDHLGTEQWARMYAEYHGTGPFGGLPIGEAIEIHIEQSGFISEADRDVGIVVGGIGGAWRETIEMPLALFSTGTPAGEYMKCRLDFAGVAAHTGATPPNRRDGKIFRRDALVASGLVTHSMLQGHALLLRSECASDTGFTQVPHAQIVELLVPTSDIAEVEEQLKRWVDVVREKYHVEMSYALEPFAESSAYFVGGEDARAAVRIPVLVSELSTAAYEREGTDLGKTRVTAAYFRLKPGELYIRIDGREVDAEASDRLHEEVHQALRRQFPRIIVKSVSAKRSSPTDTVLTDRLRAIAKETIVFDDDHPLGRPLTWREMASFPGHDLDRIAAAGIPVVMVFLRQDPHEYGISHHAGERLAHRDLVNGFRLAIPYVLQALNR